MKTLVRIVLLLAVAGLAALGVAATARAAAPTVVAWQNPVWHQATCAQPEGSVDIPFGPTGVEYALDTIPGPGGNYLAGVGTHEVMALTLDGYVFTDGTLVHVFPDFTVVAPTGCGVTPPPPPHPGHGKHHGYGHRKHHHHRPPLRPGPPPAYCTPNFQICTG